MKNEANNTSPEAFMTSTATAALIYAETANLVDAETADPGHAISIPMVPATDYDLKTYSVIGVSESVYRTAHSTSPTRVKVWGNTHRPNPRNGQPVRYGDFGPRDGGNGKYLDPSNRATDQEISVLLSTECSILSAHGDSTGTKASGQVYAPETLREGDVLILILPNGTEVPVTARFPRMGNGNGHGEFAAASASALAA
jgi:hypothetical protein